MPNEAKLLEVEDVSEVPMEDLPVDDSTAKMELDAYYLKFVEESIKAKLDALKAELRNYNQDIKARETYASLIFGLVVVWLIIMFFVIYHVERTETIVLALIGSTTASVIGLFTVVAKYLFSTKPPPNIDIGKLLELANALEQKHR